VLERVHLHAKRAFEIRMSRRGRRLDAMAIACPCHDETRSEQHQYVQQHDQHGQVDHDKFLAQGIP